jgi:hypothetical protein
LNQVHSPTRRVSPVHVLLSTLLPNIYSAIPVDHCSTSRLAVSTLL